MSVLITACEIALQEGYIQKVVQEGGKILYKMGQHSTINAVRKAWGLAKCNTEGIYTKYCPQGFHSI
jgi:hypothetical protein